jgi:hypothetical protein
MSPYGGWLAKGSHIIAIALILIMSVTTIIAENSRSGFPCGADMRLYKINFKAKRGLKN